VGLPPELLNRVFDVFFQQPQSIDRSKGGLGLGLAIVRSLTEMHGGRVSAFSEGPGRGSEFVVELPAQAAVETAGAARATGAATKAEGQSPRRVLVVDDNADAADTLADLLTDLGYVARATYDAVSALDVIRSFRPELCFLDIGLPVMDGYELATRVRQMPEAAGVRLVAVTGYGRDADRQRARAAGFDGHLVKPVSLETLDRVLTAGAPNLAG